MVLKIYVHSHFDSNSTVEFGKFIRQIFELTFFNKKNPQTNYQTDAIYDHPTDHSVAYHYHDYNHHYKKDHDPLHLHHSLHYISPYHIHNSA